MTTYNDREGGYNLLALLAPANVVILLGADGGLHTDFEAAARVEQRRHLNGVAIAARADDAVAEVGRGTVVLVHPDDATDDLAAAVTDAGGRIEVIR